MKIKIFDNFGDIKARYETKYKLTTIKNDNKKIEQK